MNTNPQHSSRPKHAWISVERVDPPKRPADCRISDFEQVGTPYDEATACQQASRCIQCPDPICVAECPQGTPIVELLRLTADGQFKEATELLFATHSIPEIAAHTCVGGRACESVCVLSGKSDPVPIRAITRFLLNYGWEHGLAEPAIEPSKNQSVAVIGSGICGLVTADSLSRLGYSVTVFDSRQYAGGRMMNGLPGFRVDKSMVKRRIQLLKQRGIRFNMNVEFGQEVKLRELRQQFDAVFLGFGRAEPVPLEIPGAELKGVYQAHQFVAELESENTAAVSEVRVRERLDVTGRRVVVLGGGDTAMDAMRMAIRRGASEAVCLYRRDMSQLRADREESDNAQEEGAQFLFKCQATAVLGDAGGNVRGVRCVRTHSVDSSFSRHQAVVPITGTEFEIDAEVVLVAYGFTAPRLPQSDDFARLDLDECGHLRVNSDAMTDLPGVFAGGSIVRGPAPLCEVVRDSRDAAAAIDRFLTAKRKR